MAAGVDAGGSGRSSRRAPRSSASRACRGGTPRATTWAPNSTDPVTSTSASICSERQISNGSSVIDRSGRRGSRPRARPARRHTGRPRAGVLVDRRRAVEAPAVDRGHAHPGHAVGDLVREPLGHESGADHADADRASLRSAGLEHAVSTMIIGRALHQLGRLGTGHPCPDLGLDLREQAPVARPSPRSRSPAAATRARARDRRSADRPRGRGRRTRPPGSWSRSSSSSTW